MLEASLVLMIASVLALSPWVLITERHTAMAAIDTATMRSKGSFASGISGASAMLLSLLLGKNAIVGEND